MNEQHGKKRPGRIGQTQRSEKKEKTEQKKKKDLTSRANMARPAEDRRTTGSKNQSRENERTRSACHHDHSTSLQSTLLAGAGPSATTLTRDVREGRPDHTQGIPTARQQNGNSARGGLGKRHGHLETRRAPPLTVGQEKQFTSMARERLSKLSRCRARSAPA